MDKIRIISSLKSNTAFGPDGISSVMLKDCAGPICSYLSTLFNCPLYLGRVPQDWKTSNITTIFKSNELSLISNYRPISLLSIVSKILEHCNPQFLISLVLQHEFLSTRHFGFRPGSSTQEAILYVIKDRHDILERKGSVVCVFFDLPKGFDTLPHSLTLESLASTAVSSGLYNWFVD